MTVEPAAGKLVQDAIGRTLQNGPPTRAYSLMGDETSFVSSEQFRVKRDSYADGACQLSFSSTLPWIAGNVPFSFRFAMACQAFSLIVNRYHDMEGFARLGQFADVGLAVRSAG